VSFINPKHMVVEARDDQGAVIGLMKHHVEKWGDKKHEWPVEISFAGSGDEIFELLPTRMKTAGLQILGIILDADDRLEGRWGQIRSFCDDHFLSHFYWFSAISRG